MFKVRGFTLIELLVVLVIIALLLSIISPRYLQHEDRAKEIVLKENLSSVRYSIDQFYSDRGEYPFSLQELVDQKYLKKVPVDTITNSSDTWELIFVEDSELKRIRDIKSGAAGKAKDGTEYSSW